jgi:hypothetical protein
LVVHAPLAAPTTDAAPARPTTSAPFCYSTTTIFVLVALELRGPLNSKTSVSSKCNDEQLL